MTWLKRIAKLEPAVLRGAVVSVAAVLALLGFEWATEANAITVSTMIVTVLPLLTGVLVRPSVTPNALVGAETTDADEPAGYEAGEASVYPEGTPVDVILEDSPATKGYDKK